MRLWTLHPEYLDSRGLVALWREALLAQAVLGGKTKGYTNHPQLIRFRSSPDPMAAIASFLREVHAEAVRREYHFDAAKILCDKPAGSIATTRGQLDYEWAHLIKKLRIRDPQKLAEIKSVSRPKSHPLFRIVPGEVEEWERVVP
ncbi:MAG: pyrimidine dimer DNA glycosylase/endonuclease V [Kiritimatiellales bacterium]|nr:pyrimidine dimer DNA glycosylase/endonuclease V [Kiritimatiellales bacterium]